MITDTSGNKIDENLPIYGCEGCNTTGGRSCCPIHGLKNNNPIQNCDETDEDTEIARAISRANYGAILGD